MTLGSSESVFTNWIAALDERHLADLTLPEVGRALRALSSCYVERRSRLAEGAALEGAGKRDHLRKPIFRVAIVRARCGVSTRS